MVPVFEMSDVVEVDPESRGCERPIGSLVPKSGALAPLIAAQVRPAACPSSSFDRLTVAGMLVIDSRH
jgi:hypothetical protein